MQVFVIANCPATCFGTIYNINHKQISLDDVNFLMKTRRNFESRLKEKLLHVGEGKFNIYIETLKRYRYPSSVYSSFPFDSSNKFHPKRTPQLCFPGESTYL